MTSAEPQAARYALPKSAIAVRTSIQTSLASSSRKAFDAVMS